MKNFWMIRFELTINLDFPNFTNLKIAHHQPLFGVWWIDLFPLTEAIPPQKNIEKTPSSPWTFATLLNFHPPPDRTSRWSEGVSIHRFHVRTRILVGRFFVGLLNNQKIIHWLQVVQGVHFGCFYKNAGILRPCGVSWCVLIIRT